MVGHSTESHLKWLQWNGIGEVVILMKGAWPRGILPISWSTLRSFSIFHHLKKMLWSSLGSTFWFGAALFCQLAVSSIAILSTWHFINLLFDILPFHQLAISSTCHFINLPFHQLANSSTCHLPNLFFCLLAIWTCFFYLPYNPLLF